MATKTDSTLKGLPITYISERIKGKDVIVIDKKEWNKITAEFSKLRKESEKLAQMTMVSTRLKGALKEVKLIETGKLKPTTSNALMKELRKIQKNNH